MFASIRNRLILIGLLIAGCVFALVPRTITVRARGDDGIMHDKQEKRVPIKYGLDLQGGMHLALELDQSKQVSADPKRDLELALTVLRKRIDEFGVTEPLIQKVGDTRIVVELAGITEPARAKAIVQRNALGIVECVFRRFAVIAVTRRSAVACDGCNHTLKINAANAVIVAVGYEQAAFRIKSQIVWRVELGFGRWPAIAAKPAFAHSGDYGQATLTIEFEDAMRPDVGDVQIAFVIQREAIGINQPKRRGPPLLRVLAWCGH